MIKGTINGVPLYAAKLGVGRHLRFTLLRAL